MTTPIAAGPIDRRVSPLPCPFCGDTDVAIVEGSTFRWRQVECNNCGARCGETRVRTIPPIDAAENEGFAIEEWNKRANAELRGAKPIGEASRSNDVLGADAPERN